MRAVLFLVFVLFICDGFAQCTKKKDDMTGVVSVNVPTKKIGGTGTNGLYAPLFLSASLSYIGDEYILYLLPQFITSRTIHHGELIYFKFDDASVITIPVNTSERTRRGTGMPFVQGDKTKIYETAIDVTVTGENLNSFKTKKLVKVRCDTEDYNIHGKDQKMIAGRIKCMESTK